MKIIPFANPDMKIVLTPMMEQYWRIKYEHHDKLVFYRMGDFYELFSQDAIIASKELDIVLTRRGKNEAEDIPMCGVPYHSAEPYIAKLIQKGYHIAVCEQMESPEEAKKRGVKGPLKRDVVRIITPGTLTEESLLSPQMNNYLVALSLMEKRQGEPYYGLAAIDISTGEFLLESVQARSIATALTRFNPSEIILPDLYYRQQSQDYSDEVRHLLQKALEPFDKKCTPLTKNRFNLKNSTERLCAFFKTTTLEVFGDLPNECLMAGGVILDYVYVTQKETLPRLGYPRLIKEQECLFIDASTQKNLELIQTQNGDLKGSLFSIINRTKTAIGARLLAKHLMAPLIDVDKIKKRLAFVTFFYEHQSLCHSLKNFLESCPDGQRALSRLNLRRGGPKDLGLIRQTLRCAKEIANLLIHHPDCQTYAQAQKWSTTLLSLELYHQKLENALLQGPLPLLSRDGGFLNPDYDRELHRLVSLKTNSQEMIQNLQDNYSKQTGISNLKIKHNNILGFYVDISGSHLNKIPSFFIHRQSLSTSHRYTTTELADLEKELQTVDESLLARELMLYEELLIELEHLSPAVDAILNVIALLDLLCSHATLAIENHYTCPILDHSLSLSIQNGRHPVVEEFLKKNHMAFTPNDTNITDEQRFWLITGPNMGGKSTYLRQNALIIIMAQMGMYVPAEKAHIGIVDRLSSRVGASDDLAAGRSTFMMEMIETASILHQSTERSFVILDEIGRGTATYDGLAIAQAVTEYLYHQLRTRTIFATHYHELTKLSEEMPNLGQLTIQVESDGKDVVFLHKVIQGTTDRSYGVHVAHRAGLPLSVIQRAQDILSQLEQQEKKMISSCLSQDSSSSHALAFKQFDQLKKPLEEIDPNDLTPKDALELVFQLKHILNLHHNE